MSKQTITAFFDNANDALKAWDALVSAGIASQDITSVSGDKEPEKKGFWESLFGSDDEGEGIYREGLRRGGTMLTAYVEDAKVDPAVAILEKNGSVDLDERENTWQSEGWSRPAAATRATIGTDASLSKPTSAAVPPTGGDKLQAVEEQLNVGKRAVRSGKIRISSHVVEKPVSEDISLRNETVSIERHPVAGTTIGALGADLFKERTIEMEETREEPVVSKTARVTEEVGIRKDVDDRVHTVTDTVRSTKIDVEDGRTAAKDRPPS